MVPSALTFNLLLQVMHQALLLGQFRPHSAELLSQPLHQGLELQELRVDVQRRLHDVHLLAAADTAQQGEQGDLNQPHDCCFCPRRPHSSWTELSGAGRSWTELSGAELVFVSVSVYVPLTPG